MKENCEQKLRIYLDSCCFNRPFDDLSQDKIRFESEAVLSILSSCEEGIWDIFKGDVLEDEIYRITNLVARIKVLMLYSSASIYIPLNDAIIRRGRELENMANIKPFDALHLASAEYGGADIFLTTDKKLLNRAAEANVNIKVANPAVWLMEVMFYD